MPITNDILYSGHLQHESEMPDMEQKHVNRDNRAHGMKRSRVDNLNVVKWVVVMAQIG